ncbi:unnamed protein product [Choristocarpus tenellus]
MIWCCHDRLNLLAFLATCLTYRTAFAFVKPCKEWSRIRGTVGVCQVTSKFYPQGVQRQGVISSLNMKTSEVSLNQETDVKTKPFPSRKLGSFEKMLTQTRDGRGPAEEGVRTLMTPHAWVAVVKGNLSKNDIKRGVIAVLAHHPMLRSSIRTPEGPKEPVKNILGEVRADGDPLYFCETECESLSDLADMILTPETTVGEAHFERYWQDRLEFNLDNARFEVSRGPNWCLEVVRAEGSDRTALVCTMNHALEDQRSSNVMLDGILAAAAGVRSNGKDGVAMGIGQVELPPSMETALVEGETFRAGTAGYMWSQATSALSQPRLLPDDLPSAEEREKGGDEGTYGVKSRKTFCEYTTVPEANVAAILQACRDHGVTMSAALSAACLMACSDVAHTPESKQWHRYKFLMAVDLRRFGEGEWAGKDWTGGTVACAGGAIDYVVSVKANSGQALIRGGRGDEAGGGREEARTLFWKLAGRCKQATSDLVKGGTAREAVAVFDWAMENMDIWASLDIESRNVKTLGRAYTVGVSNMGRYPYDTQVGGLSLEAVHYATSHASCGSLYQVSCGTVAGSLCMTGQFAEPVVNREAAQDFMRSVVACLQVMAVS